MADGEGDQPQQEKTLEVRVTELENALKGLMGGAAGPTPGPVFTCSPCSVCQVCHPCYTCQVCHPVCRPCYPQCRPCYPCGPCVECSCGPCINQ
jgi:hypothetical protein